MAKTETISCHLDHRTETPVQNILLLNLTIIRLKCQCKTLFFLRHALAWRIKSSMLNPALAINLFWQLQPFNFTHCLLKRQIHISQ